MKGNHLSILSKAKDDSITYYVGDKLVDVDHLKNCTLICRKDFNPNLQNVELIRVDNPQLEFYKLSKQFEEDYLDNAYLIYSESLKSYIHQNANIGENVKIGAGSVIGEATIEDGVEIHSNVTIYKKSIIKSGTVIQSNTSIGGSGMMWVWDNNRKRVYLEQLGNVIIGENCQIGTQIQIVRGSANESTIIGNDTCIAHGSMIGHGCSVGNKVHMANGVKLGGTVVLSDYNFLSSGSIVSARVSLNTSDILLGSGAVAVKDINEPGVYVGCPAKKIKDLEGKHAGVPYW